jgi:DUF1680 family protein
MNRLIKVISSVTGFIILISGCLNKSASGEDYPIQPVTFTSVKLTDNFWAPRIKKNAMVTIPIAFGYCESTGRVKNFEIAGGLDTGKFQTIYPFDDSDVFKIIEGASYSLQTFPDPKLESYLDTLIRKIGLAQEDDGYLYTNRTIAEKRGGKGLHEWASKNRWELDTVLSHELYNLGHLYEAAVAHYQATGKRTLLDIALKSADLVNKDFGWDRVKVYPGHQVIEMGLVKLYRVTGEKKYLDLARFFLDVRGPHGDQYNQADKKVIDQTEAVGHSVRATYMYSGMADIAAIEGDKAYLNAITRIWEDLVYGKMYVTGGIGASGGNEGFAAPYMLPNMSAYCETCASITGFSFCMVRQNILTFLKRHFIIQCFQECHYQLTDFSIRIRLNQMVSTREVHGSVVPAVLPMLPDSFLLFPDIFMQYLKMPSMSTSSSRILLISLLEKERSVFPKKQIFHGTARLK